MIQEIKLSENCQIKELEKSFPQVFVDFSVNRRLKENNFTKIFTLKEDELIGFFIIDIIYDRMELTQIEVKEKFRNQKKASQMMEYILKLAEENKLINITLEVCKENKPAIHLYQKYGFQEVAIRKNYYHGIDGILMERKMM